MNSFTRSLFMVFSAASFSLGIASVPSLWPSAAIAPVLVSGPAVEVAQINEAEPETTAPEPKIAAAPAPAVTEDNPVPVAMVAEAELPEVAGFAYPDHSGDVTPRTVHFIAPFVDPAGYQDFNSCDNICQTLFVQNDLDWMRISNGAGESVVMQRKTQECSQPICLEQVEDTGLPTDRTMEFGIAPQNGPGWADIGPGLTLRIYDRHGPFDAAAIGTAEQTEDFVIQRMAAAGLKMGQ